jgi:DNA (cytosine-5)-methyltransferase 1
VQPTVWPADCAGTLGQSASGTGSPGYSNQEIFSQNAANLIPQPVPFTKSKRAQSVTDNKTWVDGQVNPTLSLFDQGDTRATTVAVAFPINTLTLGGRPDAVNDKRMTMGVGENGDPQFTLQAAHGHAVAMGFNWQNGGGYGNANEGLGITVEGTGPLQRCNTPAVAQAMTVRRLTPRECERLQGFPDDWTLIPWRKKPAEDCPDGPRYKALGNSMACNCMAWIGERIAALENNR